MKKYFTILFLIFTTILSAQQPLLEKVKIPFTLSPNGHIIINAKINGVDGTFIFDTGAGMNLLTKKFADKITDLEKTHHFHTGHRATGEAIQSDLYKASSLYIADYSSTDRIFAVYDLEFPLDGLISLTAFKNQPFTIDFKENILHLESESSLSKIQQKADFKLPLQVKNDRGIEISVSTTILLNNTLALNVGLDSGAGFGVYRFNSKYMKDLYVDSTKIKSEFKPSYFIPKEGNTYYYTEIDTLSDINKNTSITNFNATFIEGLLYEGIMGINWLGNKLTFDIDNKLLTVIK